MYHQLIDFMSFYVHILPLALGNQLPQASFWMKLIWLLIFPGCCHHCHTWQCQHHAWPKLPLLVGVVAWCFVWEQKDAPAAVTTVMAQSQTLKNSLIVIYLKYFEDLVPLPSPPQKTALLNLMVTVFIIISLPVPPHPRALLFVPFSHTGWLLLFEIDCWHLTLWLCQQSQSVASACSTSKI